jgi:hypothetical protein
MVFGPLHPPAEPAVGVALRRLTADSTLRALRRTSPPTVAVANRGTSQIDGCEIFSWRECLSELVVNVNPSFSSPAAGIRARGAEGGPNRVRFSRVHRPCMSAAGNCSTLPLFGTVEP